MMLARAMDRISSHRTALVLGYTLAAGAIVFPLGVPSLAPEITWDLGLRYPRGIDWNNSNELAHEIRRAGLSNRLIADYQPSLCPSLAVFVPVSCEKGHWVEVKPRHDAADDIPAADKAYIVPLPMDDPLLAAMQKRGWIAIHGGVSASALITLVADSPPAPEVASFVWPIIVHDSQWLGKNVVNNTIQLDNWRSVASLRAVQQHRMELRTQRVRAGHIELSCLVYANSLGTADPRDARTMRRLARGFGVIASFLSDDFTIDYVSETHFATFKYKLNDFAMRNAGCVLPNPAFKAELKDALANVLYMDDDIFAERPTGDLFPWVAQR
jgi:hypothetical protein